MTPGAPAESAAAPPGTPAARKLDRYLVEGPIAPAVWKMAWPTVLQNAIGGLQGIIDHAMVGHYVGYTANAAIGVSWQIFLVVIVFIASLFTGMGVLVARFAGANQPDKVNRTVYQAFLTAIVLALGILAPLGYVLAPTLLDLVNATPAVQHEALPFLRIMFVFSIGMLLFFMLGGALRSAGDARTPLRLGIVMTILNVVFNVILIPGWGPVPALGTRGAAIGTVSASLIVSSVALWMLFRGKLVVHFPASMSRKPDWSIIRSLFRFGLPAGIQGVAMNVAGVMLLRFIGSLPHSAEAQAAYAVGYAELFSLITWTSVGLMGAAAAVAGQNLGAGHPERAIRGVQVAARIGLVRGRDRRRDVPADSRTAALDLRPERSDRCCTRHAIAALPVCVGVLHHRGPDLHGRTAGHRGYAQSSFHHPDFTGRRPPGPVRCAAEHGQARRVGRLVGDRAGSLYALQPVGPSLPAGQMATYRG